MTINFGVNYLAVIVAAIAAVVIGILYYGVLCVGDRQSRMLARRAHDLVRRPHARDRERTAAPDPWSGRRG